MAGGVSGIVVVALLASVSLNACGNSAGNEDMDAGTGDMDSHEASDPSTEPPSPFVENPGHILFDLQADPVQSPYPYNYYREPASGQVLLDGGDFSNLLLPLAHTFGDVESALAESGGFATYAPLVALASVPLDSDSLPHDPEASLLPDSPVRLVELDGDIAARSVPIQVDYREMDSHDGPKYLLTAVPAEILLPGTTYLLVYTDELRSGAGEPLGMSRGFAAVTGLVGIEPGSQEEGDRLERERDRLIPRVQGLPDGKHVIAAVDFTTGHAAAETGALMSLFAKGGQYTVVEYDLDGSGDGLDDVLWGDDWKECPASPDELAYGIHGRFRNVNFTGPDGHFHKDGDGWTTFEPEEVEFWLMVPRGEGPFPTVVMLHGAGNNHHEPCPVAREFLGAGMASLRFDLPRHGHRGFGQLDFLDFTDLVKTRDNFRQASADLASVSLLIEALSSDLDLLPQNGPDGEGDLDGRIGLLGQSLGGFVSAFHFPFSDRIHSAVVNVGGAGLFHMIEAYVLPEGSGGFWEIMGLVHLSPHVVSPADGVTYANRIIIEPYSPAHAGKHLLVQELIGDTVVPNVTTELLARFSGIPLLEPFVKPVEGVPVSPADKTSSGLWQYTGAGHGQFMDDTDNPNVLLARRQASWFLESFFESGQSEIVVE